MTSISHQTRSRADYLAHRYGGAQGLVNHLEMRRVGALLKSIPHPIETVLDAPSGHGRFTPVLRTLAGRQLLCADHHLGHLHSLRQSEPTSGAPFHCVRLDLLEALPFADRSFDLVLCFRFLHHVFTEHDVRLVLGELTRVTAGSLIFSYYDRRTLHALQKHLQYAFTRRRRKKVLVYSRKLIHGLLADQGYRILSDRALLPGLHAQRVVLAGR